MMRSLISGTAALILASAFPANAQSPGAAAVSPNQAERNLADFDFVTSKIAANYAGWDTKVTAATKPKLDALTTQLRAKAPTASDDELLAILQEWTGFFKDRHTQITSGLATAAAAPASVGPAPAAYPSLPWSEQFVRSRLRSAGKARDPIEGIWNLGRYRVGIMGVAPSSNKYDAVVLTTTSDTWKPGQIKAELARRPDGTFDTVYRAGDHHEVNLVSRLVADGSVLDLAEWGPWTREFPKPADPDKVARVFPVGDLFLKRLSAKTLWLRIPDFGEERNKPLQDLIAAHRKELESTPNLLIDLRNNGGGSDYVYAPLVQFLYTRPIIEIGAEFRASADNIALRHAVAERIKPDVPDAAASIEAQNRLMQQHLGEYVQPNPRPFGFYSGYEALSYPRRVAVLIDKSGSTAEQFLLLARQSHKVTLFGKENSAGVLDFANVVSMPSPSDRFNLQWAASRSLRVPDDPVDPDGIAPDIRIPAKVSDPVLYARDWLDRQVD